MHGKGRGAVAPKEKGARFTVRDLAAAVAAPRLHHQWMPDEVKVEPGFPDEVLAALRARGHSVAESMGYSSANSILVTPNGLLGAPDPRTRGAEAAVQ